MQYKKQIKQHNVLYNESQVVLSEDISLYFIVIVNYKNNSRKSLAKQVIVKYHQKTVI